MPLPQMYPAPAPAPSTNFNTLQLDMLQKYACIRQERSSNKEPEQQAAEKEAAVPKALPSELAHAPHAHSAAAAQPPPPLFAHWPSQIFAGGAVQVAHVHNPVQMVHMQANMSRPPEAQVHVRRVGSEYARGTALVYSPEEWSKAHVHSQQPQGPCRPHRHPPPPLVRESVAVVGAAHSGSEHAPAAGTRHVQAWFQHQAECESEEGELGDSAGFHDAQAEFSGSQSSGQNSRRASAIDAEQSDHDDDDNAGHSRLRRSFCCSRDSLGEDECTEAREGSWSGSHSESDSCCSESSDDGASSECAPPLSDDSLAGAMNVPPPTEASPRSNSLASDSSLDLSCKKMLDSLPTEGAGERRGATAEAAVLNELLECEGPGAGGVSGPLEFVSVLGKGASSVVWLARDAAGAELAVKVLKLSHLNVPRDKLKLHIAMTEHMILHHIKHPAIVDCRFYKKQGSAHFVGMELLKGGSLADLVLKKGNLHEDAARECFWNLLQALRVLHENQVVHHDVKLENCILQRGGDFGSLKLLDFGLAHVVGFSGLQSWFAGTYQYMPPEMIQQRLNWTEHKCPLEPSTAMDMWSAGVCLFKLLSGMNPFRFGTTSQVSQESLVFASSRSQRLQCVRFGMLSFDTKRSLMKDGVNCL